MPSRKGSSKASSKSLAGTPTNLKGFGWIPDLPDHRDHLFAAAPAIVSSLPPKIDLRAQCPSIYDQGRLGSCTANAIGGAIEFDQMKQGLSPFVPARLFIYYNERVMLGPQYIKVDSGARIRDGIKSVAKQGACPETEWTYSDAKPGKFSKKPGTKCYKDAVKYKAVEYQAVAQDLNQMKGCLAAGYPFVFGVSVYNSFMSQQTAQAGDIPMPSPSEGGPGPNGQPAGHAMLMIGYDDSQQRFLLRNSWGTGWGVKGYGTIPYAYLLSPNLSDDFWTIRVVKG